MKISKVNNTRSAVGSKNADHKTAGMLYTYPGGRKRVDGQFDVLNNTAQRLYNLFNPINVGEPPKVPDEGAPDIKKENYKVKQKNFETRHEYSEVVKRVNQDLKKILFTFDDRKKRNVLQGLNQVLAGMARARCGRLDTERAHNLVVLALRRSLKQYAAETQVFLVNLGNSRIDNVAKESIGKLLEAIKEDYEKSKIRKNTVRAVQNQNMPVQPDGQVGNALTLSLPTETTKEDEETKEIKETRKAREKRGERAFLALYADLDAGKRMDLLRRLRRLVDLFFWGNKDYNQLPDYNVWEQHESGKVRERLFIAEIPVILKAAETRRVDMIEMKEAVDDLRVAIRKAIMDGYHNSHIETEANPELFFPQDSAMCDFWIHHIENAVERILKTTLEKIKEGKSTNQLFKLEKSYLCEKVWKNVLSFIGTKYIAVGKAVFHYGMNQMDQVEKTLAEGGDVTIGKTAASSISSFDYEIIKANETLQRETAVCVAFAANTLHRAVMREPDADGSGKDTDLLAIGERELANKLSAEDERDAIRQVLQFFGGYSTWDTEKLLAIYQDPSQRDARLGFGKQLVYDISRAVFAERNKNFHFMTRAQTTGINSPLYIHLFEQETERAIAYEKEKFYSNNLPLFYSVENLKTTFRALYATAAPRAAQIPAFSRIVVRKGFPDFLRQEWKIDISTLLRETEQLDKWYSAVYYLLKEIYYNAFTLDGDWLKRESREVLLNEWDKLKKAKKQADDAWREFKDSGRNDHQQLKSLQANKEKADDDFLPLDSFKNRFDQLRNMTFAQICQTFMTDYNLQNSGTRKGKSSDKTTWDPGIYNHYRMLLYWMIREAFFRYVKANFNYLWQPKPMAAQPERETFIASLDEPIDPYKNIKEKVRKQEALQTWFIACHFMNPKTLNGLAGSLRSYVQYVREVMSRAKFTENKLIRNENDRANAIENQYLRIVDLCIVNASNFSNDYMDYFRNKDDYAMYLSRYVDFYTDGAGSASAQLDAFCNDSQGTRLGTFMDVENPILNRNVVLSKLFGPARILSAVVKKISGEDFDTKAELEKANKNYFSKGLCANRQEQEALLKYQRLVNRIELRSIAEFGEIINDLLGQLINWSFLRERDLLYFQLGFHYTCLQSHPEETLPEAYCRLTEVGTLHSAILYQVAALYVNGYPVLGEWNEKKNRYSRSSLAGSVGPKIKHYFTPYANKACPQEVFGNALYDAGLEVFENTNDHDALVDLRNGIDHFRYYSGSFGSILDLYSEIFDRFFSYDMKYAKNVANMLGNILLKHFTVADLEFTTGTRHAKGAQSGKARAQIAVQHLASDSFTYKLQGGQKPIDLPARDREYLDTLARILYYPQEAPEGLVRERRQEKRAAEPNRVASMAAEKPQGRAPSKLDEPEVVPDMETALQNLASRFGGRDQRRPDKRKK